MKWKCTCICNIDMSLPWDLKTCFLEDDGLIPYPPERCPFTVRYTNWEKVEE